MWPLLWGIARQYAPYIVMPIAAVVGTIGYYAEKRWNKPVQVPYMDISINDARLERQLNSELSNDYTNVLPLMEEKKKFVPKSSLDRNPVGKKMFE
uniref:Small integral membrane protein 12 n=1 Tax=Plectus sambesii TaxID=2011161 RepID=A0A914WBF0_9BILA